MASVELLWEGARRIMTGGVEGMMRWAARSHSSRGRSGKQRGKRTGLANNRSKLAPAFGPAPGASAHRHHGAGHENSAAKAQYAWVLFLHATPEKTT